MQTTTPNSLISIKALRVYLIEAFGTGGMSRSYNPSCNTAEKIEDALPALFAFNDYLLNTLHIQIPTLRDTDENFWNTLKGLKEILFEYLDKYEDHYKKTVLKLLLGIQIKDMTGSEFYDFLHLTGIVQTGGDQQN